MKTTEGLDDLSMEMLDYHDHFTLTADGKEHGLINWSSEEYEADGVKGVRWIGEPIQRLADAANCTLEETSAPHISDYVWKEAKYRVEQEDDENPDLTMNRMGGAVSIRHEVNQGTTPDWCTGNDSAYHVIADGDASVSYQIAVDLSKMTLTPAGAAQLNRHLPEGSEKECKAGDFIWNVMKDGEVTEFGGSIIRLHVRFPSTFERLILSDFGNLTSDHAWFTVVRVENEENDTTGLN